LFLSLRDALIKWAGYNTVFEGLKDLGVSSFELFINREMKVKSYLDAAYAADVDVSSKCFREDLKKRLKELNLSICAILVENDFSSENLKREVDYVLSSIEVASGLEVSVVRINAVMRSITGYSMEKYAKRVADAIEECMDMCRNLGVSLAIENHGVIANRREFLRLLFQTIDDEHLGLTLDTGNFYWFGYPLSEVYSIVEEFAPRVKHTHIKNAVAEPDRKEAFRGVGEVKMAPLYQGDIDLRRIVSILRRAGYNYDLTIEDESLGMFSGGERINILKRDVEYIQKLL